MQVVFCIKVKENGEEFYLSKLISDFPDGSAIYLRANKSKLSLGEYGRGIDFQTVNDSSYPYLYYGSYNKKGKKGWIQNIQLKHSGHYNDGYVISALTKCGWIHGVGR